jgi:hypothetical protein
MFMLNVMHDGRNVEKICLGDSTFQASDEMCDRGWHATPMSEFGVENSFRRSNLHFCNERLREVQVTLMC